MIDIDIVIVIIVFIIVIGIVMSVIFKGNFGTYASLVHGIGSVVKSQETAKELMPQKLSVVGPKLKKR